eukprot:360599-Amphidinium_carterae.1
MSSHGTQVPSFEADCPVCPLALRCVRIPSLLYVDNKKRGLPPWGQTIELFKGVKMRNHRNYLFYIVRTLLITQTDPLLGQTPIEPSRRIGYGS